MHDNNIKSEQNIEDKIKTELEVQAYIDGKKQGRDWFKNNINAINNLIPSTNKLSSDFELQDRITTLYHGNNTNPKIEYVSYDHWMNHEKYNEIEKSLNELLNMESFGINKAIDCEAEYFYERISKLPGNTIIDKELFIKKTKDYIFDETIPVIIKNAENPNTIEIYYGGRDLLTSLYFQGKKAQKDPIIQQYLQGSLKGADKRKFVSVKISKE
jgi:hypothetical protein